MFIPNYPNPKKQGKKNYQTIKYRERCKNKESKECKEMKLPYHFMGLLYESSLSGGIWSDSHSFLGSENVV